MRTITASITWLEKRPRYKESRLSKERARRNEFTWMTAKKYKFMSTNMFRLLHHTLYIIPIRKVLLMLVMNISSRLFLPAQFRSTITQWPSTLRDTRIFMRIWLHVSNNRKHARVIIHILRYLIRDASICIKLLFMRIQGEVTLCPPFYYSRDSSPLCSAENATFSRNANEIYSEWGANWKM